MSRVFVTLQQENYWKDLALPGDIPSQFLAQTLAKALDISLQPGQLCSLELCDEKGTKKISPARSMEEARIMNGSFIRLSVENVAAGKNAFLISSTGIRFLLNKPVMIVGRPDPKSDISIDVDLSPLDEKKVVSRKHAVIRQEDQHFVLVDAQSRNGTWINDTRLAPGEPHVLHPDNRITFGNINAGVELIFSKG